MKSRCIAPGGNTLEREKPRRGIGHEHPANTRTRDTASQREQRREVGLRMVEECRPVLALGRPKDNGMTERVRGKWTSAL